MQYYVLMYHLVDDYVTRRAAYREEHLSLARQAHDRGDLIMGGALSDPADQALLVFRSADASTVEAFVHTDPYVKNGLIKRWEIRPWTVVVGQTEK